MLEIIKTAEFLAWDPYPTCLQAWPDHFGESARVIEQNRRIALLETVVPWCLVLCGHPVLQLLRGLWQQCSRLDLGC